MTWAEIGDKVFAWFILFCLLMFVASLIGGAISNAAENQWRKQMVDWQEGRIRNLEWDKRNLESDLRWQKIDLDSHKRRADYAEERNDRLWRENAELYRILAKREVEEGEDGTGSPAHVEAAAA